MRADAGFQVDGRQVIDATGGVHTARSTTGRYGYFEGRNNAGARGFYLGYGPTSGSYVNLNLGAASQLYVSGGNIAIGTTSANGVLNINGAIDFPIAAAGTILELENKEFIRKLTDRGGVRIGADDALFIGSGESPDTVSNGASALQTSEQTFVASDNNIYLLSGQQGGYNNALGITIFGNGSVGIGDTSPDGGLKVDISGNIGASAYCDTAGNNCTSAAAIAAAAGGGGADDLGAGGSTSGTLFSTAGHVGRNFSNYTSYTSGTAVHYNGGTESFRADAGGINPAWGHNRDLGGATTNDRWYRVYANQFLYISDKRFKTNFERLNIEDANILDLTGYRFDWNDHDNNGSQQGMSDIGLIAQEVEQIFPEFVSTDENGYKAVDYVRLVVPLLEVTKKQEKKIDELSARLDKLENK